MQREHNYAIVDEADSTFIDEARTPLIIGGPSRPATNDEKNRFLSAPRIASCDGINIIHAHSTLSIAPGIAWAVVQRV